MSLKYNLIKNNIRFASFFWLLNGFLLLTIGFSYWQWFNKTNNNLLTITYLISVQYGLFCLFGVILLFIHSLTAFLSKKWFYTIGILLGLVSSAILAADTLVFAQYRFHFNGFIIELFFAEGVIHFSWFTWLIAICLTFILFVLQLTFCWLANKLTIKKLHWPIRFINYILIIICLVGSQLVHIWEDANYRNRIPSYSHYFPLYYPITAKRKLMRWGWVNPATAQQRAEDDLDNDHDGTLKYPLQAISFKKPIKPYNILFILIDAWRYDDFNSTATPHLYQFAQQSIRFNQHVSGGNATLMGIYSLFYSIPPTYWTATNYSGKRPIFMQTLADQGYQFTIHSSAALNHPPFDRTVFRNITNLTIKTVGSAPIKKDRQITLDFLEFLNKHDPQQPFMGFMFYDAAHGYDLDKYAVKPFQPYWKRVDHIRLNNNFDPLPYHNRYLNALYNDDLLIGNILNELEQKGLLEKTIIIFSSDHGEEFNDNKKNYWGHGSNYSKAQIHVPLFIYWPNKQPQEVNYQTTHYDIIPTLMTQAMGVTTPANTYSIGHDLFAEEPIRQDVIIGSYYNYAVVSTDEINVIQPNGQIERLDNHLNHKTTKELTGIRLKAILDQMSRFFQK